MGAIQLNEYQALEDFVVATTVYAGELTIEVKTNSSAKALQILKDQFGFHYLSDITGIDYYTDDKRFGVAYNLVNMISRKRLRVLVRTEEKDPSVASAVSIWPSAAWYEREVWDMLGIRFPGNPDLRRIYMPEDFEYFPLRKEFPLIGIPGSIQVPEPAGPKGYK